MQSSNSEIQLTGLSGSDLIGFMAALGTFVSIAETGIFENAKMYWSRFGVSYVPTLSGTTSDAEGLIEILHSRLSSFAGHSTITIDKDLKIQCDRFRLLAKQSVLSYLENTDLFGHQMTSAFGCDAIANDLGAIRDSAFRTMGGAGHQHFLEFMNLLAKQTTADQIRETLFGPWLYRDPGPSMRWDSQDDRRYALRWDEPSGDPVRTVRGANRLAIAALPFFPVIPISSRKVATTGFGTKDSVIRWPLWGCPLNLDTVRSVIGMAELQSEQPLEMMTERGVFAVYSAQRLTLGKFRNFTPATAL